MKQFMLSMGYDRWTNVVGLRADEMRRVAKQQARNEAGKERWQSAWPLVKARVQKHHIWLFWLGENLNPKRSEEHTSELQSLMRKSYAVFCLKKKTQQHNTHV